MSPLLQNAVVSIQLGLEDFASEDDRRVISAVRNLYSGVLLLCKEVLRQLSPPASNDILIRKIKKAIKDPDGSVRIAGAGKKTVDRFEIEETFKQLQLAVDLSNLKRLAEIRNDIEHLHPTHATALIQEAVADAMPIIRAIIVSELEDDPGNLLGLEAWNTLLDEAKVFKTEADACKATFENIQWNSESLEDSVGELRCPNCSSSLLKNESDEASSLSDLDLVCSKCGETSEAESAFEKALGQSMQGAAYIAMTDGGEPPLENCPECGLDMYVVDEGKCVNCDFSLDEYECAVCSTPLSVDDYRYGNGDLCSYCQHVMSKADRE
jgi:DNA-directed RNA polymerase subunit M/transcription elongation factor TFIIS